MANENRIGALWKPDSQSDKAPLGKGNITVNGHKISIVVWPNRWKQEGERTPDYYIELDVPREQTAEPPRPARAPATDAYGQHGSPYKPAQTPRPGSVPHRAPPEDFTDDIAF